MASLTDSEARVELRLSYEAKAAIEAAAALSGQSLGDFAVSTLLEKANQLLGSDRIRSLSERDAKLFLSVLDAEQPNQALREAAAWYQENRGAPLAD